MAVQVINTRTASLAHGIKAMIYGNSGMGKTRLCASAPRPIIVSAESGLLSLRHFDLPAIPINSLASLKQAQAYLAGPAGKQFQTICLDSASEIAEGCLAEAKRSTKDGRKAYGEVQDTMIEVFRNFRDIAGKHVIFLAKQEFAVDGNTGGRFNAPSFPGNKLAQAAPYFFDEVWQLVNWRDQSTGAIMRGLRTQPDQFNTAKSRTGTLQEFENADPATGGGLSFLFSKMLTS